MCAFRYEKEKKEKTYLCNLFNTISSPILCPLSGTLLRVYCETKVCSARGCGIRGGGKRKKKKKKKKKEKRRKPSYSLVACLAHLPDRPAAGLSLGSDRSHLGDRI